jgi:hypothetical protein
MKTRRFSAICRVRNSVQAVNKPAKQVLASLLEQDNKSSIYVRAFASVRLLSIESIAGLPEGEKPRPIRKVQMYWAILHKAGFRADEKRLRGLGLVARHVKHFDPHFNEQLRVAAYEVVRGNAPPDNPSNLDELVAELGRVHE